MSLFVTRLALGLGLGLQSPSTAPEIPPLLETSEAPAALVPSIPLRLDERSAPSSQAAEPTRQAAEPTPQAEQIELPPRRARVTSKPPRTRRDKPVSVAKQLERDRRLSEAQRHRLKQLRGGRNLGIGILTGSYLGNLLLAGVYFDPTPGNWWRAPTVLVPGVGPIVLAAKSSELGPGHYVLGGVQLAALGLALGAGLSHRKWMGRANLQLHPHASAQRMGIQLAGRF